MTLKYYNLIYNNKLVGQLNSKKKFKKKNNVRKNKKKKKIYFSLQTNHKMIKKNKHLNVSNLLINLKYRNKNKTSK